jgi:hypothetical protein
MEDRMDNAGQRPRAATCTPSHRAATHNRIRRWFEAIRQYFRRRELPDGTVSAKRQLMELGQPTPSENTAPETTQTMRELSSDEVASIVTSRTDPDEVEEVDFIIGAPFYLPRGMITLLFGAGGTSKSSLAAEIGAHLVLGKPFLGGPVQMTRVYYAELEDAGQIFASSYRKIRTAHEQLAPGAGCVIDQGFHQRHFLPEEQELLGGHSGLLEALKANTRGQFDVYIFDSFEALARIDSNDGQLVRDVMFRLRAFAREMNAAVLLIDHTPKGNPHTPYGSAKKRDFSAHVVNITNTGPSGTITLRSEKCNVGPLPEFPPLQRLEDDSTLRFRPAGMIVKFGTTPSATRPSNARLSELIEAAKASGAANRTKVYEAIAQELRQTGELPDAKSDTVSRWILGSELEHLLPRQARGRRAA